MAAAHPPMPEELARLLRRVDQRKAELDRHRPLAPLTAASLRDKPALDWTWHSNAIEGNTLSLHETKVVLENVFIVHPGPRKCPLYLGAGTK